MQSMNSRLSRLYILSRIGALLIAGILVSGCASTGLSQSTNEQPPLTAIVDSPTNAYHPGKFVWFDLLTPDAISARAFYSELFGWSFEQQGPYAMILNNGHRIGGILEVESLRGEYAEPLWLASMSVADVDKASSFVQAQGGKVLKGPVDMPDRGRGVLVSDPLGAQLVLLHASGGDPADVEPEIGAWVWNEIWTNQPHKTSQFYQSLGGYTSISVKEDYEILLSEENWRGGVRYIANDVYRPQWVPTVRVAEPETLLDKVEALGGVVWLRPDEAPSNGNTALISDSGGAILMIQRWSPEQLEVAQ